MLSFWDLSQIELALAANGLGWEGAPPDGDPDASQTGPVSGVRLERGWGRRDESINWYLQQVMKTNPDQADLSMELAWIQVMGPTKFRDATKALPLCGQSRSPRTSPCASTRWAWSITGSASGNRPRTRCRRPPRPTPRALQLTTCSSCPWHIDRLVSRRRPGIVSIERCAGARATANLPPTS